MSVEDGARAGRHDDLVRDMKNRLARIEEGDDKGLMALKLSLTAIRFGYETLGPEDHDETIGAIEDLLGSAVIRIENKRYQR